MCPVGRHSTNGVPQFPQEPVGDHDLGRHLSWRRSGTNKNRVLLVDTGKGGDRDPPLHTGGEFCRYAEEADARPSRTKGRVRVLTVDSPTLPGEWGSETYTSVRTSECPLDSTLGHSTPVLGLPSSPGPLRHLDLGRTPSTPRPHFVTESTFVQKDSG